MNITLGRLMLLGALVTSVLGCQIEELDKGDDIHEVVLFVHNGLAQVTPDESDFIDLADFVQFGAGVETRLERVVLINNPQKEHCNAPIEITEKGLGFSSTLKAGDLCQYRYTVKGEHPQVDGAVYQDGVMTVVGSTASDAMMTPIAYVMEMTKPTKVIDIAYELDGVGDMFPSDYTLHGEVILLGDGEVLDVDSADKTVTYEAHNEGPQRIIYILEDDNGTEHKYGRIDIAVSSEHQQGPVVDSDIVYDGNVKVHEEVTIDVSKWVTLPPDDSDAYQLTYVDAFNATVASSTPDDIMNKAFTFEAAKEGGQYVSFSVSDHQGGYDIGLMEVMVSCLNLTGECIDIFTGNGKLFTNSPSVAYLDSIGGSANDGFNTEDGIYGPAGDFFLFNWDYANRLCELYNTKHIGGRTNWRLPEKNELVDLYDISGDMFAARGWPTSRYYWSVTPDSWSVSPDGSHKYYNLSLNNGEDNSYDPSGAVYASCISDISLAEERLDIFDTGYGKLFTNSPSVAYLDSIDGTASGSTTEDGSSGPVGDFSKFHWYSIHRLCDHYSTIGVGGRTNWLAPTADELSVELFGAYGKMFTARGWPTGLSYWSAGRKAQSGSWTNHFVNLNSGNDGFSSTSLGMYASCVSNPLTLAEERLEIFNIGTGKLFTNSPSVAYLNSIGGSANDGFLTEGGTLGPIGDFYVFKAGSEDNAKQLCWTYNAKRIGGRTNWRLPTVSELSEELFGSYNNMFLFRHWPTNRSYVTSEGYTWAVRLNNGLVYSATSNALHYVSCVSSG